jgi:hypothetical protein
MNPFPAMNSRSHFLGPAPLSAVASFEQVDLALPPVGTVCEQDHVPFSGP